MVLSSAKSWVLAVINFLLARVAPALGLPVIHLVDDDKSRRGAHGDQTIKEDSTLRHHQLLPPKSAQAMLWGVSAAPGTTLVPPLSETEKYIGRLRPHERLAMARALCNDLTSISDLKPNDFVHTRYLEVLAAMCKAYPDVLHIVAHDCETLALLVDACKSHQPQARDILEQVLNLNDPKAALMESDSARLIVAILHAICVVKGPASLNAAIESLPNVIAILQSQLKEDEKAQMRSVVVLRNLTRDSSICVRMFETPGLVSSLIECCRQTHASITRENAFAVLFRICNTVDNTDRMFAHEGVVPFLLESTELCMDDAEPSWACEWAVVILLVLLNSSDANKTALLNSDRAVKALCMASTAPRESKNDRVREWATGGLMVLASGANNRRRAYGLLDQFVLLTNEGCSHAVKHHALLSMASLALDEENLADMKRSRSLVFCLIDLIQAGKASDKASKKVSLSTEETNAIEATTRNVGRATDLLQRLGLTEERVLSMLNLYVLSSVYDIPRVGMRCPYRHLDRHLLRLVGQYLL